MKNEHPPQWTPDGLANEWGIVSRIADACEALHMSLNGSADPLSDNDEDVIVQFLRNKLHRWHNSYANSWRVYDECYRMLIIATLLEYDLWREKFPRQVEVSP